MAETPNGADPMLAGGVALDLIATSTKAQTDAGLRAARSSVVSENPVPAMAGDPIYARTEDIGILWAFANKGDGMIPWGTAPTSRDRQLRAYAPTEPLVDGAIASVSARNAAMPWVMEGPDKTRDAAVELLENANFGAGWVNFVLQVSWDLYTQDKGAFIELIREADSPTSPVIGIKQLDAVRCWSTGRFEDPVIYRDIEGRLHRMMWYQVHQIAEMPAPNESFWGLQQCALTRVMRASQVYRNINIYMDEKTGGRHTRAIHFVNGVTDKQIETAVSVSQAADDSQLRQRFGRIPIVTSVQRDMAVSVGTLELSSLPDGFDSEKAMKEYLTVLSLGFLVDFQEFAPLPGGNLGTSSQSEILAAKSRAKGPALFRKLIEHMMNRAGILPQNVEFRYDIVDPEEDRQSAENRRIRSEAYEKYISSGMLSPEGAVQLAIDAGDITEEVAAAFGMPDLTPDDQTTTSDSATGIVVTSKGQKAISSARRKAEASASDDIEGILEIMQGRIDERMVASAS